MYSIGLNLGYVEIPSSHHSLETMLYHMPHLLTRMSSTVMFL